MTRLLAYGLPIAVTGAALLTFNYARFGDWWQFGYSETFNGSLAAGLSGFLVSPDRSIFLAAPLLLALPWSWPVFWRRNRRVAVTVLVTALVTLVVNGAWPVFWGGPVWGPRYLLPMLPLLFLSLAPFAQAALDRPGWQRVALPLLALAGVALTLPDVIWNRLPIVQTLGQHYPLWRVAPRPEWLDLAWLSTHPQGFLLAGGLLIAGIIALVRPGKAWLGVTSLACIAGSVILLSWLGASTLGYTNLPAYGEALGMLASQAGPGDAMVLNPARYQDGLGEVISFLNAQQLQIPVYAVYREDAAEPEAGTSGATDAQRIDQIFRRHGRLWLLTQGAGEGDANSTTERYLARTAAIEGTQWLADGRRLTAFARPVPALARGESHTALGGVVSLDRWEIGSRAGTEREPESVQVLLHWRPLAAVNAPLHTFVQAWDAGGKVLAQWSGVPGAGFEPTQNWQPDQPVDERVSLVLPADRAGGSVDIVVGMYDSANGERLRTADGRDYVVLQRLKEP